MLFRYPVAIDIGGESTAWGVVVPDIPSAFSAGDTLEEAIENAREAILFALEDYAERGEALPIPSTLGDLVKRYGSAGPARFTGDWVWHLVDVDTSKLTAKAVRLNITLPEPLLKEIDKYVSSIGATRSGYLASIAQRDLNEHHAA